MTVTKVEENGFSKKKTEGLQQYESVVVEIIWRGDKGNPASWRRVLGQSSS